jgi:CO/xanthine dehydrogenase Mo-binding subunit
MGLMIGSWYPAANLRISATEIYTNRSGAAAYRAPGLTPMAFALEQLVDELARELELSPLSLRARNVARADDKMADGAPWAAHELPRLLAQAAQHPLWNAAKQPGEGVGVAIGAMRGSTEPASASVRLIADGTLSVSVGSIDITGTNGALAQIAAETFGVPLDQVRVSTAASNVAPHSGGSGGSKILYTVGNAVVAATRAAREQALEVAAELLEVGAGDLELADGVVRVLGAPDRALSLKELASTTSGLGARFPPVQGQGNVVNATKAPGVAVHLARVKVDRETGEVGIVGYAALHDVGQAINPAEVEGQIHGGVVQGVGWAFFEALRYDAEGQPLTASYMDYALPKASEAPDIETRIYEFPAPEGPYGAKGIGEPPVIPPAAALANAIFDATGVRLRELPMTAERVWRALNGTDAGP